MQYIKEAPFGDSHCYRVFDVRVERDFCERLFRLYGLRPPRRRARDGDAAAVHHPGAVPCSLMREDLRVLRARRYAALPKTDGTRYTLLLTTCDGAPWAVLFDRACKVRVVRAAFAAAVHARDTLLDGELVRNDDTGRHEFRVFDCVASGRRVALRDTYERRMHVARAIVADEYRHDARTDTFAVRVKRYARGADARRLATCVRRADGAPADGLVLVDLDAPVAPFRNRDMYKWKWQHTIDVLVVAAHRGHGGGARFTMMLHDEHQRLVHFADVDARRNDAFLRRHAHAIEAAGATGVVVECVPEPAAAGAAGAAGGDGGGVCWRLDHVRADRRQPNCEYTVQRTARNVAEAIALDDVLDALDPPPPPPPPPYRNEQQQQQLPSPHNNALRPPAPPAPVATAYVPDPRPPLPLPIVIDPRAVPGAPRESALGAAGAVYDPMAPAIDVAGATSSSSSPTPSHGDDTDDYGDIDARAPSSPRPKRQRRDDDAAQTRPDISTTTVSHGALLSPRRLRRLCDALRAQNATADAAASNV